MTPTPDRPLLSHFAKSAGLPLTPGLAQFAAWVAEWSAGEARAQSDGELISNDHSQLLRELADELYSCTKPRPIGGAVVTQPLWRVMHQAFHDARDTGIATPAAHGAELRAVADAVPEKFYGANGVRAWLLEEAQRAEAEE